MLEFVLYAIVLGSYITIGILFSIFVSGPYSAAQAILDVVAWPFVITIAVLSTCGDWIVYRARKHFDK